jgi:elongation factor P--beta-lysine ligase
MTNWRPSSGPDAAMRRAAILRRLREYFDSAAMLEVDTPALSPAAASALRAILISILLRAYFETAKLAGIINPNSR